SAQCPPARFRSLLAIERGTLAQKSEEASTACRDTQSQRSPNQALVDRAKLFLPGASQAKASLGCAMAHWDQLIVRAIHPARLSRPCYSLARGTHAPFGHHDPRRSLP